MKSSDDKPNVDRPSSAPADSAAKVVKSRSLPREQETGAALRSAYQRMVDEQVPDEMMDLLGKLG